MRGFFAFNPPSQSANGVFAIIGRALAFATHFEKNSTYVEICTSAREAAAQVPPSTPDREMAIFDLTMGTFRRKLGQRPETLARRYEQLLGASPELILRAGVKARNAIAHDIGDSLHEDDEVRRLTLELIGAYTRQIAEADRLIAVFVAFELGQPPPDLGEFGSYPDRAVAWVLGT